MRTILLALVAATAFLLLPPAAVQAADRMPDEPGGLTHSQPGSPAAVALSTFDLEVYVQNATNLGGFEFDVVYDRTAAQITGITPRSLLGQTTQCTPNTMRCATGLGPAHKSDRSRVGAYSFGADAGATGAGLVAVIHVQTNGDPAALTFALENLLAVAIDGKSITENVTFALTKPAGDRTFLPLLER